MTVQPALEIQGNLVAHCTAELVSEIVRAELTGSLRLSDKERKAVLYFKAGRLSYAISNARKARLFDMLITRQRFTKEQIAAIPNFGNDLELAAHLESHSLMSRAELDQLAMSQLEGILIDVFSWIDGSWSFSPLARVRDGLDLKIDVLPYLMQFARCLTPGMLQKRLQAKDELFSRAANAGNDIVLILDEEKAVEYFSETESNIAGFVTDTSMPEADAARSIYTCWLAGLLNRANWTPAFSPAAIRMMRGVQVELKREATRIEVVKPQPEPVQPKEAVEAKPEVIEETLSVQDYLNRVERAITLYDVLGIDAKSPQAAIKAAYLSLAKNFHPDHFHKESPQLASRVQSAFAELAKAYETLRTEEARELYDFRMKKELAERQRAAESGMDQSVDQRLMQARASYDRARSLASNGDFAEAEPFFARAAHFDPKNAKYRAEYGRQLARDPKQKHKAEAELQAAVKLAPEQPSYRLMLAQFFVDMDLRKRAEGELSRLLKAFPDNREALALLETLR
jgi:tetratricopeptide (TPR) repeat protein